MFEVTAGTYEDEGENCKYAESFESIDAAITAREKVCSYPWSRLTVAGQDFVYEINPVKHLKKVEALVGGRPSKVYIPCTPQGEVIKNEWHD